MKFSIVLFSATILMAACDSTPKVKGMTSKTTDPAPVAIKKQVTVPVATSAPVQASSESNNTANAKTGWSKTAKGAVIGGVVGAGTGAIINKRNRAAGAVVGGVAGAGAGAIIGNELDKKDGRH